MVALVCCSSRDDDVAADVGSFDGGEAADDAGERDSAGAVGKASGASGGGTDSARAGAAGGGGDGGEGQGRGARPGTSAGTGGEASVGAAAGAGGFTGSAACETELVFDQRDIDHDFTGENKALADLNGDGLLDVIVAGLALRWYQAPDWTMHEVAEAEAHFIGHMQAGDIDGDGAADLVTPDGDFIFWFENPGGELAADGGAWVKHLIGDQEHWTHELELGDMNRDGKLDVVTNQNLNLWLQGDAPTEWQRVPLHSLADAEGLALGHVDGDERLDLAVRGHWIRSPEDASDAEAYERFEVDDAMHDSMVIEIADIDEDGASDLVYAPKEDNVSEIVWYSAADPTAGWTKHVIAPAGWVHEFVVADFDGAGRPDVAFAEMAPGPSRRVGIFVQTPAGEWTLKLLAETGSHNIVAGDLGNDCDLDIVGANWETPPVQIFENLRCDAAGVACH